MPAISPESTALRKTVRQVFSSLCSMVNVQLGSSESLHYDHHNHHQSLLSWSDITMNVDDEEDDNQDSGFYCLGCDDIRLELDCIKEQQGWDVFLFLPNIMLAWLGAGWFNISLSQTCSWRPSWATLCWRETKTWSPPSNISRESSRTRYRRSR